MGRLQDDAARVEALGVLSRFRLGFHGCLTARAAVEVFARTGNPDAFAAAIRAARLIEP